MINRSFICRRHSFPLPHQAFRGRAAHDIPTKTEGLSKIKLEDRGVCVLACVYVQHILPCCLYPFSRYCDEFEYEGLNPACMLQSKRLDVLVLHEKFVEVSYHGGKNQEDGVFCHKGLRQMVPTNVGVFVWHQTFPLQETHGQNL